MQPPRRPVLALCEASGGETGAVPGRLINLRIPRPLALLAGCYCVDAGGRRDLVVGSEQLAELLPAPCASPARRVSYSSGGGGRGAHSS